jgi:DNA-binding response OmpR family regulator
MAQVCHLRTSELKGASKMGETLTKQPTVFLVEEEDDSRNLVRRNLQTLGYGVHIAIDEEDAMDRISLGNLCADLLVVDLDRDTTEEILNIGRAFREQLGLSDRVPLVVTPGRYDDAPTGIDLNAGGNDWITYFEDVEQLNRLLLRLVPVETAELQNSR